MKTGSSKVHITHLFPREMSTYGDRGNVLCLQKRLEWRGFSVQLHEHHPGDTLPKSTDLIFMGGGQDSGQRIIQRSMAALAPWVREHAESATPALMICGAYQLLGEYFLTQGGDQIEGVGLFDAYTEAASDRLIGNIQVHTNEFGNLIGFENHSGRTFLRDTHQALGKTKRGMGNNGSDKTEGIRYQNFIGTYLHGPILPKNPFLADWLIAQSLGISHTELAPLEDTFIVPARTVARHLKR